MKTSKKTVSPALRFAFSKRALEQFIADNNGTRAVVHDSKQKGLILELRPGGAASFQLYKRTDGRPTRYTIGRFPEVSVENARKAAAKRLGDIADGRNPQAARHEHTLQGLFDHWLESQAKLNKRTWAEDHRQFNTFLKHWNLRRLSSIHTDVQALHSALGRDHGRYAANRCLSIAARHVQPRGRHGLAGHQSDSRHREVYRAFPRAIPIAR